MRIDFVIKQMEGYADVTLSDEAKQVLKTQITKFSLDRRQRINRFDYAWGCVQTGLVRTYYFREGKEYTVAFASEGNVISSFESCICDNRLGLVLEALEETEIYFVKQESVERWMESNIELYVFSCKIMKKRLQHYIARVAMFQSQSMQERYSTFSSVFSRLLHRVSSVHVASYLGMTPETLSRIRSVHK